MKTQLRLLLLFSVLLFITLAGCKKYDSITISGKPGAENKDQTF